MVSPPKSKLQIFFRHFLAVGVRSIHKGLHTKAQELVFDKFLGNDSCLFSYAHAGREFSELFCNLGANCGLFQDRLVHSFLGTCNPSPSVRVVLEAPRLLGLLRFPRLVLCSFFAVPAVGVIFARQARGGHVLTSWHEKQVASRMSKGERDAFIGKEEEKKAAGGRGAEVMGCRVLFPL